MNLSFWGWIAKKKWRLLSHWRPAILLFLFLTVGRADESLSTRFEVWPPETKIIKLRPGEKNPKLEVGQGNDKITFSLEKDFAGNPLGSMILEFQCEGYESVSMDIEAAELNSSEVYRKPVTLKPIGRWASIKDFFRKNQFLSFILVCLSLSLSALWISSSLKKRKENILSGLSGDGTWTEKAGYYLVEKIGTGATATTWRAIRKSDLTLREILSNSVEPDFVAFKHLEKDFPEAVDKATGLDPETRREIESAMKCNHPTIIKVEDFGVIPSAKSYQPYIVMEYAKGSNLHSVIKSGRRFSVVEMLKVASQLCDGLKHLHDRGAIHRDIKPENFIISDDLRIKIVDLGLAKTVEEQDRLTALSVAAGGFKGTGGYAPPWQMGATEIDPSFDQYATAVSLAEMLAGCHPFELPQAYKGLQGPLRTASRVKHQVFIPLEEYRNDLPVSLCRFFKNYFQAQSKDEVFGSMEEFHEKLVEAAGNARQ